ncbi:MAG: ABC transporter permease subunit [Ignavibacteriales bacterium]|nr:ABC transporter permease subunit [Ignavibacteriales bacterium]
MLTLIQIELYKIFKKWRTYIGFFAIGTLVPVIHIAMYFSGSHTLNRMTEDLGSSFFLVGNLLNGYFVSYFIMMSLVVHIPFLITLVSGDLLAGEASAGTYRMLITRPISRTQIITSKFLAGIIYTTLLIIWLAFTSLILGSIILGTGELLVTNSQGLIVFAKGDILWRFFFAYAYATLSMSVVASLAFLFSALVENAIGPIITTMAVIIVFLILSAIPVEFIQSIKPFLFTSYLLDWMLMFKDPIDSAEVLKSVTILFSHILVFYFLALFIFKRKDILT